MRPSTSRRPGVAGLARADHAPSSLPGSRRRVGALGLVGLLVLSSTVAAQDERLGAGSVEGEFSAAGAIPVVLLTVYVADLGLTAPAPNLFALGLTLGDHSGQEFAVSSGEGFLASAAMLTNGQADAIRIEHEFLFGASSSSGVTDTELTAKTFPCFAGPDLIGSTIERFELKLETYLISIPPIEECQAEGFADACSVVEYAVTLEIYGAEGVLSKQTLRFGTPPNPLALVPGSGPPVLGGSWRPRVDHSSFAPAATLDFLIVSRGAADLPQPGGTLLVDLSLSTNVLLAVPAGREFDLPIPNDCSLVGRELHAQGAAYDPNGPLLLTNALDPRIGTL